MNACALVCVRAHALYFYFCFLKTESEAKYECMCTHVCVCVCVCERERERERERDLVNQVSSQLSVEQQARSHLCLWLLKLPWSHQHFQ